MISALEEDQRRIEKHYFDKFCAAHELRPEFVEYGDKPDVVMIFEGKPLGVEITNFYKKPGYDITSEQRQRSIRARIVEQAQSLYDNSLKLEIVFGFGLIEEEDVLADRICAFLNTVYGVEYGTIRRSKFAHIPELRFVHIIEGAYDDAKWRDQHSSSIGLSDPERLSYIISEKEKKILDYKKCYENWLLVVIDFIDTAQDQEISNVDFSNIHSDKFEKIFLYKTAYEQVIEFSKGKCIKHFDD